jgi:hypothetical protein
MLQGFVQNVSSLFQMYICKCSDLDVVYVSHMLQAYIPNISVLYCSKYFHVASCKSLFGSCIYYNGYTRMLQVYVSNVLAVFRSMLQLFYLDVAYAVVAIHICCKVCF